MSQSNVVAFKTKSAMPHVVSHNVTPSELDYLRELHQLGMLEGEFGNQSPSAEVIPLLQALHQVLAGGSVEIKVTRPGNARIVAELDEKADRALREANEVNCSAGHGAVPFIL